jgi:hypothetical protein
LMATLPAGVAGPADIVVLNAKAKVKSFPNKSFTYYDDIMVSGTNPDPFTIDPEGIDAPAKVDVTFNQDADPTSVMIKVAGANVAEVAGKIEQDATDTKMFSFIPDAAMKAGTYTVTVSGAKAIAAQNVMPADHTFSFKVSRTVNKSSPSPSGKGNVKVMVNFDSRGSLIIRNNEGHDLNNIKITVLYQAPVIINDIVVRLRSVVKSIMKKYIKAFGKIEITKNELERNGIVYPNTRFVTIMKIYLECDKGEWESEAFP